MSEHVEDTEDVNMGGAEEEQPQEAAGEGEGEGEGDETAGLGNIEPEIDPRATFLE